jgi:ribosomal protein S6E (S10)
MRTRIPRLRGLVMSRRHLSHATEGTRLRNLANNRQVELLPIDGVLAIMNETGQTRMDLLVAIRNGSIVRSERRGLQWRRTVRGQNIEGNLITIIVTVAYPIRRISVLELQVGDDDE